MLSKHVAHLLVVWSVSTAVAVLAQTTGSSSKGRQPADAPSELRKLTGADAKQANKLRKAIIDAEKAGQWAEAVAAAEEALELRTRVQGAEHFLTIDAEWRLKTLRRNKAMSREERASLKQRDDTDRRVAAFYQEKKYADAQPFLEKSLEITRRLYGEDQPETAASYSNLGTNLEIRKKYTAAQPILEKALAIRRRIYSADHPLTADACSKLALNYRRRGKPTPLNRFLSRHWRFTGTWRVTANLKPRKVTICWLPISTLRASTPKPGRCTKKGWQSAAGSLAMTASKRPWLTPIWRPTSNFGESTRRRSRCVKKRWRFTGSAMVRTMPRRPKPTCTWRERSASRVAMPRPSRSWKRPWRFAFVSTTTTTSPPLSCTTTWRSACGRRDSTTRRIRCLCVRWRFTATYRPTTTRTPPTATRTWHQTSTRSAITARLSSTLRRRWRSTHACWAANTSTSRRINRDFAVCLMHQAKYEAAGRALEKALAIYRRRLTENHLATAAVYEKLGACSSAQGKYAEARDQWLKAAGSVEGARLFAAFSGMDRASATTDGQQAEALAAVMARLGQPEEAFQRLEENLGRGLLDELAAREDKSLTQEESARLKQLVAELDRLDHLFEVPIAGPKNSAEIAGIADLRRQRERARIYPGRALRRARGQTRSDRRQGGRALGDSVCAAGRRCACCLGRSTAAWSQGRGSGRRALGGRGSHARQTSVGSPAGNGARPHLDRRRFETGRRGPKRDHPVPAAEHSCAAVARETPRAAVGSALNRAGTDWRRARRGATADRSAFPRHGRRPDRAAARAGRPLDGVVRPIWHGAGIPPATTAGRRWRRVARAR